MHLFFRSSCVSCLVSSSAPFVCALEVVDLSFASAFNYLRDTCNYGLNTSVQHGQKEIGIALMYLAYLFFRYNALNKCMI